MDTAMQLSDRIGRRMKLHDLHVLMAVVQAGSMSKAAQLLNTTQPAISRSIADLEHTIGVRLLDRGRQGVEPTEYGRALLDGGVAMFDDLRQAVKSIEFLTDPTVGEVRIGTHDPIIVGVLPAVFDRLHRKYPGISIHVTPIVAERTAIPRLARAQARSLSRAHDATDRGGHSCGNPVSRPHQCRGGTEKQMGPPTQSRVVRTGRRALGLPPPDSTIGSLVADAFRARGMKFPPKGVAWGSASLICALLPRGPFLGTLPASLLRFGANLPRLKVLPVDLPIPPWPVGIMTLKNRTLTPVVKLFIDCAREVVKPLADKK